MFTAILTDASKEASEAGLFSYSIVYTDGVSVKYQKNYTAQRLTDAVIEQTASNEIEQLNAAYADAGTRNIQAGQEIPITSKTAQATPERDAFMRLYAKRRDYERAIAAGFVPADDAEYLALAKQLQGLWLPDYIGLV